MALSEPEIRRLQELPCWDCMSVQGAEIRHRLSQIGLEEFDENWFLPSGQIIGCCKVRSTPILTSTEAGPRPPRR